MKFLLPFLFSASLFANTSVSPTCQDIELKFLHNVNVSVHPTKDIVYCPAIKRAIIYAELLDYSGCKTNYDLDTYLQSAREIYKQECK